MSFASKVLYTGDGVTTNYNVPMPYISQTHISVFVNQILQLTSMNYVWSGPSTIIFSTAPGLNDAIEIRRWTSPTAILVDYVDGSVLNATDLDTGYLHTYYLSQEYADSFNEVINASLVRVATAQGIEATDPDQVILELIADMLANSASANLQARITDIDANAEAIISLSENLQVQINTLAQGIAANVYLDDEEPVPGEDPYPDPIAEGARWYDTNDNNKPYIYVSSAWVSIQDDRIGNADAAIDILQVDYSNIYSAIVQEQFVRSTETTGFAQLLSLIGVQNGAQSAFILNLDTAKVSDTESLAERFTALSAATSDNAADIVTEAVVAADATSAVAGTVTSLTSEVDDNTSSVSVHATSIDGIEAEFGVDLNSNGYISGFRLINGGTPGESAFVILADKFAIVDASGDAGEDQFVPFEISNGKINLRGDVKIDGNLIVTGTINGGALIDGTIGSTQIGANAITTTQLNANSITAVKIQANAITSGKINVAQLFSISSDLGAITAGTIIIDDAGWIRGGQTGYNDGEGFFLGYETDAYKFSIGDGGTSHYMSWDGTLLTIKGNIRIGEYSASNNVILSADTERTNLGDTNWIVGVKKFKIAKSGVVRITLDVKMFVEGSVITEAAYRIMRDGTEVASGSTGIDTYATKSHDIAILDSTINLSVDYKSGVLSPFVLTEMFIKNCRIKADETGDSAVITD